jgi:tetratricopeptide (TPR) repeat protein
MINESIKALKNLSKRKNIILFLLLFPTIGWSFNPSSPEIKTRINKGIELTILCDFDSAKTIYRTLINDYPDEPVGYFYMAAVIQSQMLDEEDFSYKTDFENFVEKCIKKSIQLRSDRKNDPWPLFYEGNAYLYQSFLKSKLGNWWGAYRDAGKGVSRLEKALELDSTFYDAYLGIGSYKYWKSSKIKFLSWLPFVSDEREQGIKLVKKSIELGNFVDLIGRDQLAWILMDAGRLDEANKYALQNYELYPESRFFQWTLTEVMYQSKELKEAYQKYILLYQSVQKIPDNNHLNEVSCLLRMGEIEYEQGNIVKADSLLSELFKIKLISQVRERARSKLKQALKLKLQCSERLSKKNESIQLN